MMDKKYIPEWHVIGESVKGASHERSGLPNQDAIHWSQPSDSFPLVLAISDGHGSAKYFRSDKGAKLAVNAAIATMPQFQEKLANIYTSLTMELSHLMEELKEHLTKSIVHTWRDEVASHLRDEPFTAQEWERLENKEGPSARQGIEDNPVLAYGATLLTVMITETSITYLQLGDGDILTVSEQGETSRVFQKHERHFANETTSLCSNNAWRDFQFHVQKISPALPALILLSTDGYADSFSREEEFLKVGDDLFDMIRTDGLEKVASNLQGWLSEATQSGSGDDITLGILCRKDALPELDLPQSVEQV